MTVGSLQEDALPLAFDLPDALVEKGVRAVAPLYKAFLHHPDPSVVKETLASIGRTTPLQIRSRRSETILVEELPLVIELIEAIKPRVYELCKSTNRTLAYVAFDARRSILLNLLNRKMEISPIHEEVAAWSVSDNPGTRLDAALLLGWVLDEKGVPHVQRLYERLVDDPNEKVALQTLQEVMRIPRAVSRPKGDLPEHEDAEPLLRKMKLRIQPLTQDKRRAIRNAAREALKSIASTLEMPM
jgi:HEAT repeat protein